MLSGWSKRVRTYAIAAAALVLAGSTGAVLVSTARAGAAYDPGGSWSLTGNTATSTSAAGLVTTVTTAGDAALSGHTSFSNTNGPVSSEFDPAISMGTDALRWAVGADCFSSGACAHGAAAADLGTITIAFSEPVKNPALHLEGIGALAQNTSDPGDATAFHSTYTLDSAASGGATLGPVSPQAAGLVTDANTITTSTDFPGTSCTSTATSNLTAKSTAGCGTVHINGTVTTVTFKVGIDATVVSGAGSNDTTGDAIGFAVTFDQDTSSAPAGYDQGSAPQHVIGDLALGSGVDPANAPGDPQDALPSWPQLTTAMIGSSYPVTVPISGASRAGRVCGYIDFEHAGTFSADPQHQACASFAAGARSVTLQWTVPSGTTAGLTYARLRAAYDPAQAQRPTGSATSGEVEDYALSIRPTVTITNSLPPGTAGTYSYLVTNTGNAPVAGLRLDDTRPGATPISCAATTLAPSASTSCAAPAYTATQADVDRGAVGNATTASGSAGAATVTSPLSSLDTPIKAPSGLRVTLTGAVDGAATIGDEVTWHAVVTNTGLTTVRGLTLLSVSGAPASCPQTTLAPATSVLCTLPGFAVNEGQTNAGQVLTAAVATGHSVSGAVSSAHAVLALPVGAPIPLSGVSDLGPTLGAGGGALVAGLGLLLLAKSRPRHRRRAG